MLEARRHGHNGDDDGGEDRDGDNDVNFLLVDMAAMIMEAGIMMGITTMIDANFLLADMVMMEMMMMETTTTIDMTFLLVDMAEMMMEAGTVMETDHDRR